MTRVNLPFVNIYTRRGKVFAYYRRGGRVVRIHAEPGSEDFTTAYDAARAQWEAARAPARPANSQAKMLANGAMPAPAAPGTLAALVAMFKASPEFISKAQKTRKDYGAYLDQLATRFGPVRVENLNRAWVFRMRDEAQATPRTANYRVAIIRRLISFAVDRGLRQDNPAFKIGALKTGEGHRVWTAAEVKAMTSDAAGDVALPVLIALHTAMRRGDVLKLPWSAYDGQWIRMRQSKTGKHLELPVPAALKAVLDTTTRRSVLICATATGRAWSDDHFSHRFAEVRKHLGLAEDLHFHGLRHTRLTALAEAGATEAELMATSGHKTAAMVGRYTQHARQSGLAQRAVIKLGERVKNAESD